MALLFHDCDVSFSYRKILLLYTIQNLQKGSVINMFKRQNKTRNLVLSSFIMTAMAIQFTSCSSDNEKSVSNISSKTESTANSQSDSLINDKLEGTPLSLSTVNDYTVEYSDKELTYEWEQDCTTISATDGGFTVNGNGASAEGTTLTISSAGTYLLEGKISQGKIIINSTDKKAVRLVLNEFSISCSDSAPIYTMAADKVIVTLVNGTKNSISDTARENASDEEDLSGAIYCKSDLSFNGDGKLIVSAGHADGIVSKDKLKFVSGNFEINAADDGILGRDLVAVRSGNIKITSASDGIKSTYDTDTSKGNVIIENGTIDITSDGDGIQSENSLVFKDGNIKITSGGGYKNGRVHVDRMGGGRGGFGSDKTMTQTDDTTDDSTSASQKGLKAVNELLIGGGKFEIDSADDSIHSDSLFTLDGGVITASSGDDGIHSSNTLNINSGEINITQSYEGFEGRYININDGTVHIVSSDDGMNASSSDNSATDILLTFNGGYTYVNAGGDGLDSNGNIQINDGTVLVCGPTDNGNGPLDCGDRNNEITVNGGILVAAGSSGMFELPAASSTQNCVAASGLGAAAGTVFTLADSSDNVIVSFNSIKQSEAIVISSPQIKTDQTYSLYTGGTNSGKSDSDGFGQDGTISSGNKVADLEVKSSVTTSGTFSSSFGGGMHGGKMPGGGRPGRGQMNGSGEQGEVPEGWTPKDMPTDGQMPQGEVPDGWTPKDMPSEGQMPQGEAPDWMKQSDGTSSSVSQQ